MYERRLEIYQDPLKQDTLDSQVRVSPYPDGKPDITITVYQITEDGSQGAYMNLTPQQANQLGAYLVRWANIQPHAPTEHDAIVKV